MSPLLRPPEFRPVWYDHTLLVFLRSSEWS